MTDDGEPVTQTQLTDWTDREPSGASDDADSDDLREAVNVNHRGLKLVLQELEELRDRMDQAAAPVPYEPERPESRQRPSDWGFE